MAEQPTGVIKVALPGLVKAFHRLKSQLHRLITVLIVGLHLGYDAGPYLNGSDAYGLTTLGEELSCAYFFSDQ